MNSSSTGHRDASGCPRTFVIERSRVWLASRQRPARTSRAAGWERASVITDVAGSVLVAGSSLLPMAPES